MFLLFPTLIVVEANVLFEPGVYKVKSVSGGGDGKYLAFRSQHKYLKQIRFGSATMGFYTGMGLGAWGMASAGLALTTATIATMGIAIATTGGAAVAGVALAIPLQRMLRSNALVLSSKRVLRWQLEPSEAEVNAFTLKIENNPQDQQSGCYLNLKNPKKRNRVKLNADVGLAFTARRTGRGSGSVYLKALESDGAKWLVGRKKKVKLSSNEKSEWVLIKTAPIKTPAPVEHQIV